MGNDVVARLPSKSRGALKVPVVPSGRDKLLYLIGHNDPGSRNELAH